MSNIISWNSYSYTVSNDKWKKETIIEVLTLQKFCGREWLVLNGASCGSMCQLQRLTL